MLTLREYLKARRYYYAVTEVRRCCGDMRLAASRLGISLATAYRITGPIKRQMRCTALIRRPDAIGQLPNGYARKKTLLLFFGVDPELAEINPDLAVERSKESYRRMVKMLHPDSPNGDSGKMSQVNQAWRLLMKRLGVKLSHSGLNRGLDWQVECEPGAGECRAPVTERL